MEVIFRSELHRRGLRFRNHVSSLIGRPDVVFPASKVAVFLDSCFWHQCPYHSNLPKSSRRYWLPKLRKNKKRAKEVNKEIRKKGWLVVRFWEHQIKRSLEQCIDKTFELVKSR